MPQLDFVNVTAKFKQKKEWFVALDNVSFSVPNGAICVLVGPSGCGKSTTLFMLSGLESPSEGHIYFDDQDVTNLAAEKRGIGLVFQNYALYPHMTVEQNIRFPLDNMRIDKKVGNERALDAARLVQIEDLMKRKPSELSGGQQQRVAIARSMIKRPKIILADEPTAALDYATSIEVLSVMEEVVKNGTTLILITHNEEITKMADRVIRFRDGKTYEVMINRHPLHATDLVW